jgi:hypothetical protein
MQFLLGKSRLRHKPHERMHQHPIVSNSICVFLFLQVRVRGVLEMPGWTRRVVRPQVVHITET